MIVARLHVEQHDEQKYLVGRTVCNWEHAIGTRLVLKREADGDWVLIELGPRETRNSEQGQLSFLDE